MTISDLNEPCASAVATNVLIEPKKKSSIFFIYFQDVILCCCAGLDNILKTTSFGKMFSCNKSHSCCLSCMLPGTWATVQSQFSEKKRKLLIEF